MNRPVLRTTVALIALVASSAAQSSANPGGAPPGGTPKSLERDVRALASDAFGGRDNNTPGSVLAQNYLIGQLRQFSVGLNGAPASDDAFKQPIASGTNVLALIRGSVLPDEYVIVGAHYDHLGSGEFACRTAVQTDQICNGASDNAAGVASVLGIGRELARGAQRPRRSVILAFWDREEDGLLGSRYYVEHPLRPLAQTVAYVNYDIQGANLLPSLNLDTFAVAAETGGPELQKIVAGASDIGPLRTHLVSAIFGQGRSDYVNFIDVGVPTVFFSDSTGPCYHTAQDEIGVVDFWKLRFEARVGVGVVQQLTEGNRITFSGSNPIATYSDAVALFEVANRALSDLGLFTPDQQAVLLRLHDELSAIVAAGPANFSLDQVAPVFGDVLNAFSIIDSLPCSGYLERGVRVHATSARK
jgi:peptidase M28-like protein